MLQEFDEPHQQFFELLALWFIRTLHAQTKQDFAPLCVTFTHARDAGQREIHRLLRCPVEFAQPVDSWVLPQQIMELPIVSGDNHLLRILTVHADELLTERHLVTGLQSMVADQLISLLPSGDSRAAAVAQRLNMSTRSLTRQLAREGTTFGEILERLRRRLASRTTKRTPDLATGQFHSARTGQKHSAIGHRAAQKDANSKKAIGPGRGPGHNQGNARRARPADGACNLLAWGDGHIVQRLLA
jgi:AraC-like DNA-binding protein